MPGGAALDVVSVSLGSSRRDTDQTTELLGREVRFRRLGVDGDLKAAIKLIGELDGRVSAIGLGGIDLYVPVRSRRYYFRDALKMARAARRTPVVCGAGLKGTLERAAVGTLAPQLQLEGRKVLMVSAVDRFGMAQAFVELGADVVFGDLMFLLSVPLELRSLASLERVATLLLPPIVRLPFKWIYPTGERQEKAPEPRFGAAYDRAELIAGDWHLVKRFAPARLDGKLVLTNTTTADDVEFLRSRGAAGLITTTIRLGDRSIGTNLLEAALVAAEGADGELEQSRYLDLIGAAGLAPTTVEL